MAAESNSWTHALPGALTPHTHSPVHSRPTCVNTLAPCPPLPLCPLADVNTLAEAQLHYLQTTELVDFPFFTITKFR